MDVCCAAHASAKTCIPLWYRVELLKNPDDSQDEKDWKVLVEDRGLCDDDNMIDAER